MADKSRKRDTDARRLPRPSVLAGSIAALATLSVVSAGVLTSAPATSLLTADAAAETGSSKVVAAPVSEVELAAERGLAPLSRSAVRGTRLQEVPTALERITAPAAVARAVKAADDRRWSTTLLNIWSGPSDKAANMGLLDSLENVRVTGRTFLGREEIVLDRKARWVTAGYLAVEKPKPEPEPAAASSAGGSSGGSSARSSSRSTGGSSSGSSGARETGAACTNGTSVPSGVSPNIAAVHQAVCAAFPSITTYGTFRSDGEHAQGIAVDIMLPGSIGYQVRDFIQARYQELGVNYLIYSRQIWSADRAGEGWRGMEDRGSVTANHEDHVHVTTY